MLNHHLDETNVFIQPVHVSFIAFPEKISPNQTSTPSLRSMGNLRKAEVDMHHKTYIISILGKEFA